MSTEEEVRSLVCELCRNFYNVGWVTGTGGSISIRLGDQIFMTPSGVQKERIKPEELFVVNKAGDVLTPPACRADGTRPKLSDCSPLFLHAYNQRDAGAVLHSHGLSCNLVTLLFKDSSEFRITQQEMIKGIDGHGYYDTLVIPIIENTAWEHELADSLGEAIAKYPKAPAVLVRQHGMYVWGRSWEAAKRHAECLHYLFDSYIAIHKLGLIHLITPGEAGQKRALTDGDAVVAKKARVAARKHKVVLLDIEGTLAPITFVKDVLFPYAAKHVDAYLQAHAQDAAVQALVHDLVALNHQEPADVAKIAAATQLTDVATYVKHLIAQDRKVTPLKALQGLIWADGYKTSALVAPVYDDVARNFRRIVDEEDGKIAIYSSGSRQAQHLLFQYSTAGDLRPYLSAFFDTKVGLKTEALSYEEIAQTLGVNDAPEQVLFVTDILAEARAARRAGFDAYIASRPGNAAITEAHDFRVITSFDAL